MALKKSQLYSSLWAICDELRDGMDASLKNMISVFPTTVSIVCIEQDA